MRTKPARKPKPRKPRKDAKKKVAQTPAVVGPTKAQREEVAIAAGGGMPDSDIACALGISLAELRKTYAAELSTGAFRSRMDLLRAMHSAGMKGNTAAAKSYLSLEPRSTAPPPDPPADGKPIKPEKLGKKDQANVDAVGAEAGTPWAGLLPSHRPQ